MEACNYLGAMYVGGLGIEANRDQAILLYTKACRGGLAMSCMNVAMTYRACSGAPLELKLSAEFVHLACQGGDQRACDYVPTVDRGASMSVDTYRNRCEAGQAARCADVGWFYQCGTAELPQDLGQAAIYYKKSCDAGDPTGCDALRGLPR